MTQKLSWLNKDVPAISNPVISLKLNRMWNTCQEHIDEYGDTSVIMALISLLDEIAKAAGINYAREK